LLLITTTSSSWLFRIAKSNEAILASTQEVKILGLLLPATTAATVNSVVNHQFRLRGLLLLLLIF